MSLDNARKRHASIGAHGPYMGVPRPNAGSDALERSHSVNWYGRLADVAGGLLRGIMSGGSLLLSRAVGIMTGGRM